MGSATHILIEKILDDDVELRDLNLDDMPQEDLVCIVQALRGHIFCLRSLVGDASEKMAVLSEFARPRTKRFYYANSTKLVQ